MKKYFAFLILFSLVACGMAIDKPADQDNFIVYFKKPWFPQWGGGQEISNHSTGYRLAGEPIDLIIYGTNLDREEYLWIENKNADGETITALPIWADKNGRLFLDIDTRLPGEFQPESFYQIFITRENGSEFLAGFFYVASGPPDDLFYKSWTAGNDYYLYGFSTDSAGKPYLLSWISYNNGPNLLDTIGDRGREFQGDLIDGYPKDDEDWRWNTVVPCQGGGDYGRAVPTVLFSEASFNHVYAKFRPLDFEPDRPEMNGSYRQSVLSGRWPQTGWTIESEYMINENQIFLDNHFWHDDNFDHHVHAIRPIQVYLNPFFFQSEPTNADKRDPESYLQAVIDDHHVSVYSKALGIKITFQAKVTGHDSTYRQRQWNYNHFYDLAEAGSVQVWECLNAVEVNRLVPAGEILSGSGSLTVEKINGPNSGSCLDLSRNYVKMIEGQWNYDWEKE